MKNKDYQYIQPQVDNRRKKNKKKKKKKNGFLKFLLIFIALLVLVVTGALGLVKYVFTDFYFSSVIPSKDVSTFIDETIIGRTTTTTETATTQPTTEATTLSDSVYLESSDFKFDGSKKGAFVGNILNGGKVDKDAGIIYHVVDGRGIYAFKPDTEDYSVAYKSEHILSSFNIRGDFFYFVDESDNCLYKLKKSGKDLSKVAEGISLAYIYDTTAYCISTDNQLVTVNTQNGERKSLYSAGDEVLSFIGISLDRVFFSVTDNMGVTNYYNMLVNGYDVEVFRQSSRYSIMAMSMENGYIYYYEEKDDFNYNLVRQKYGSEKTVILAENVREPKPVIVESNRVFFSSLEDGKLNMYEINMNNDKKKVMISSKDVTADDSLFIQHGGEYDFIMGTRQNGDKVYRASSNLTGSTNVMTLKGGKWTY